MTNSAHGTALALSLPAEHTILAHIRLLRIPFLAERGLLAGLAT